MSDLIDRQAAIEAIINLWADKPFGNPALVEIIKCVQDLPSAQAEIQASLSEIQANDSISRQAALDFDYIVKTINDVEYVMLSEVQMKLRKLPSAQAEIIRCKDCKRYDLARNGVNGECTRQYATFYPWDFCSYGEEREDAHSSYDKS